MDFEEIGTILRNERERQGLSIEVVMDATKISKSNILAIENGDKTGLPHPVYAKGFVKSYARYLGLDAEELSMVVDREYKDHTNMPREHGYEVAPLAERAFQDHDGGEGRKRRSGLPIFFLIIILAAVAGGAFLLTQKKESTPVAPAATSEKTEAPATIPPASEVSPGAIVDQNDQAGETPSAVEEGSSKEKTPDGAATEPKAETPPSPPPAKTAAKPKADAAEKAADAVAFGKNAEDSSKTAVEEEQEKQKYEHILVIRAVTAKGCWVGVWKNDEVQMARDFVLKNGEPLRLMFNYPRRIRIGNVAGVTVTYNGAPYELDPAKGNIQTLTFGAE
ncbi:helix-turn-helix domain-containing protein [Pseudodesulfovibrio sp.]|uniref:helix-turn-helix domain-containing protein n=1 Tax=unclassified Pseudodesulfovibrio TaxID=2661612 RepID=UPI003B0098F0